LLNDEVEKIVTDFLLAGPVAASNAKTLISRVVSSDSIASCKEFTCDMISKARVSVEGQEGMSALLEKRKASWY
jgi:methylglutaconyl-CoA hydratase